MFWILFSFVTLVALTFCMSLAILSGKISRIEEKLGLYPIDNEEELRYNVHKEETDK